MWILSVALFLCAIPAQAQSAVAWPTEAPPRPLAAHEVRFPPYEIRSLKNGLQVIAVLHHEQPSVTMRLLVRAGAAQDPPQKAGLAYLTSHLLDQGTTTRSAEQIADDIDSIGGLLGTGSGSDLAFANVVVMKDSFATGMKLLYDVVHSPAFSPDEIARQKEQAISSLRVDSDDPNYVANALEDRLIYGLHPYGLPGTGTPETLATITRDDLRAFHQRYFVPNNMILAIVGDVTGDEAFAMADQVFGGWPRAEVVAPPASALPEPTRRVVIVDKPDAVQTEIRVGQLAIPRKHADYVAWDLAVKILGGEGANRLHQVLRSERGLTYGASAEIDAMKEAGDYVAETDTRTETTGEALRLVVEEFSRLQRQRVFERELAGAQAYLSGNFPLTIETPNEIATQVLNTVFYELPIEQLATFRERVLAVTPDDIQRVARQYIHPDRLSIVLVGNARAFIPQLRAVGFTEFEVIPIEQLDLMSGTLSKAKVASGSFGSLRPFQSSGPFARSRVAYSEVQANPRGGRGGQNGPNDATERDVPTDPNALALLRRVIDAKGGLATLKNVRTVIADADTVLHMQQGDVPSTTRTYIAYPDRFRVDAALGDARMIQVYAAGRAWVQDPAGVHDAPPAMRDDFAASARRDTFSLLIAAAEGRYAMRLLPADSRDGGSPGVLEVSGRDLSPVRFYIDRDLQIARQSYTTIGGDDRPVATEEVFSDYRTVSGIRVPFQAELRRAGAPVVTRTLRRFAINEPIDETLFARPQR